MIQILNTQLWGQITKYEETLKEERRIRRINDEGER
jgi:hypothetical protein